MMTEIWVSGSELVTTALTTLVTNISGDKTTMAFSFSNMDVESQCKWFHNV